MLVRISHGTRNLFMDLSPPESSDTGRFETTVCPFGNHASMFSQNS